MPILALGGHIQFKLAKACLFNFWGSRWRISMCNDRSFFEDSWLIYLYMKRFSNNKTALRASIVIWSELSAALFTISEVSSWSLSRFAGVRPDKYSNLAVIRHWHWLNLFLIEKLAWKKRTAVSIIYEFANAMILLSLSVIELWIFSFFIWSILLPALTREILKTKRMFLPGCHSYVQTVRDPRLPFWNLSKKHSLFQ